MAEENLQKKKPGIVKRILKWIGLAVLILLLTVSIIFQASWKISALLLIILLACTALPKPARKWFWLCVGGVIIAMVIWVFLPDDNSDWRPFTFEDELAAIEAKRAIPDEENAAVIYNDLLEEEKKYKEPPLNEKMAELMEKGEVVIPVEDVNDWLARSYSTFYPEFWNNQFDKLTRKEFWPSKDYPQIAEWLETHESTIRGLIEASQKNKCRFPIVSGSAGLGKSMDRLSSMRRWGLLLIRSANNDLGDERIDLATEKYMAVLQMAGHQYQQPLIVEYLVGLSVESLATKQLNRFVITGKATEARLNLIEESLTKNKHNWSSDLPAILECEKLMTKNTFAVAYEVNSKGRIRFNHDSRKAMREQFPEETPLPTYWQKRLTKAGIILAWFVMPSTPQKFSQLVDAVYEKLYSMAAPDFDWTEDTKVFNIMSVRPNSRYLVKLLADMSEEVYRKIHDLYVRTIAEQRGSRIIIALRRYKNKTGVWPTSLDDIKSEAPAEIFIDPINNDSYVYILTKENFMLYSKGKNNVDENGELVNTWPKPEPDDWLIWPTKKRKEQEENTDAE